MPLERPKHGWKKILQTFFVSFQQRQATTTEHLNAPVKVKLLHTETTKFLAIRKKGYSSRHPISITFNKRLFTADKGDEEETYINYSSRISSNV
jgi:hypothetical protein